jgi:hypothetical protein
MSGARCGQFIAHSGRVEDWRADFRLRWVFRRFRGGPQSGCHDHVSSPRRIERSVRVSRIKCARAHLMRNVADSVMWRSRRKSLLLQ